MALAAFRFRVSLFLLSISYCPATVQEGSTPLNSPGRPANLPGFFYNSMTPEEFQLCLEIKTAVRRLTVFIASFSILVILPTCLLLSGLAIIPFIAVISMVTSHSHSPASLEKAASEIENLNHQLQQNFKK